MKKEKLIYPILFLLCNPCINIKGQEFRFDKQILYQLTYQRDSMDKTSVEKLNMELLLNDHVSLFQSQRQRHNDSVLYYHDRESADRYTLGGGILMRPVNKFMYKILKDANSIQVYDSPFGIGLEGKNIIYSYMESLEDMDWKIKDDTVHFGSYVCQRADLWYGGRNWVAWFTMDIPISDGPYKFAGLPGLIVKVTDEKGYWDFELMALRNIEIKHAINFQKWYMIQEKGKKELYRERQEFQSNLPTITAGSVPNDGDIEGHRKYRENFKKALETDNNWIELY